MAYRRILDNRALTRAILAALFTMSCTSQEIVTVQPSFISVTPADVSAVEGEQVQLVGLVQDDEDRPLEGRHLEWSSSDPTIASVDSVGLVTARSPGEVVIRARFQHVMGEATVSA